MDSRIILPELTEEGFCKGSQTDSKGNEARRRPEASEAPLVGSGHAVLQSLAACTETGLCNWVTQFSHIPRSSICEWSHEIEIDMLELKNPKMTLEI